MHDTQQDRPTVPPPPRRSVLMIAELAFWSIADFVLGIFADTKRIFMHAVQPIVVIVGGIITTAIAPVLLQSQLVEEYYWSVWDTYQSACYDLFLLRLSSQQTAVFECERSATSFAGTLSTDFHLLATTALAVVFLTVLHWRARKSGWVRSDIRNVTLLRWAALAATAFMAWELGSEVWQFLTLSDAMDYSSTQP